MTSAESPALTTICPFSTPLSVKVPPEVMVYTLPDFEYVPLALLIENDPADAASKDDTAIAATIRIIRNFFKTLSSLVRILQDSTVCR